MEFSALDTAQIIATCQISYFNTTGKGICPELLPGWPPVPIPLQPSGACLSGKWVGSKIANEDKLQALCLKQACDSSLLMIFGWGYLRNGFGWVMFQILNFNSFWKLFVFWRMYVCYLVHKSKPLLIVWVSVSVYPYGTKLSFFIFLLRLSIFNLPRLFSALSEKRVGALKTSFCYFMIFLKQTDSR